MKITDERNRFALILIAIALIAAVPRFVLGASQFIEYDGYWHVFIAQQDKWNNFWEDIRVNAHPPLFFLLLKFLLHFGRSVLMYRSISLVTGTVSVFSLGWIARKIVKSNPWAYTAAAAYGFALPGIIISCEVRSYMLSAFFILVSFSCLLEVVFSDRALSEGRQRDLKLRTGFAVNAILACLSHYYAFFYVGAATVLLLASFAVRKYRGERVSWQADAATIIPVLGTVAVLYKTHAGALAEIQNHLLPYYYDRKGLESIPAFLLRNWKNLMNLFLPYPISSDATALVFLAVAVVAGVALFRAFLFLRDPAAVRAASTVLITAAMLTAIALAAVAGKYPFGGDLRQQFLLFPFFVLCAAVLADRLTTFLPGKGRLAVSAGIALLIGVVSLQQFELYPKVSENVLSDRIETFNRLEPEPTAVYLDQFNLITFFIYHHDWQWSSLKQQPIPGIDIYRISRGQRHMLVFRDKNTWNVKPDQIAVYNKVAECLRDGKTPEVSIFSALQTPPDQPFSDFPLIRRTVASEAADFSFCAQHLDLQTDGWYATFRQSGCTAPELKPPKPARVTGTFDGASDEIQYSGAWTHGRYPEAADGTLSYSNAPASKAQLSFEGTEITWVYARAGNRGFGSVKIDGVPRGEIDLYSPNIIWQSRTTFRGLAPGKHTFEVTVAGRKDDTATDRYIDIDALVVR